MINKVSLDTNSLNDKQLLSLLRSKVSKKELKIILSPIVILEYGFFQELHNKRPQFLRLLKILKVEIEPIKKIDAIIAIKHCLIYKDDSKGPENYFRDALIASLSERLQITLITNNINNFKGLPVHLKLTSKEAIETLM